MSLYEVSDIVPGQSLMAQDLLCGGKTILAGDAPAEMKAFQDWSEAGDALGCVFERVEETLGKVLQHAQFWEALAGQILNEWQLLMVNCLRDEFDGKLTLSEWVKMGKTYPDTALRDINDLVSRGLLAREAAGGGSTNYVLVFPVA